MTGRDLNWNHPHPEMLEVVVTCEGDQWRRTAEDYTNAIAKAIEMMRAPVRFGRISYYAANGNNYPEILSKVNPKSFLISFIPPPPEGQASYRQIKEICTKRGMRTQAIKLQRKTDNFNAIISNIAKQIINKCGHLCWWAPMPRVSKEFEGKNIMMIGIDVYHGRVERGKQPRSLGGFVTMMVNSNGNYLTAWHVSAYQARKEILGEKARPTGIGKNGDVLEGPTITQQKTLTNFILQACRVHNFNPHYIFVYRDGVADSQMQSVVQYELPQVREACPQARLTYIIVQKRIHTRFVIGAGDNYRNPPRGTLIDTILTRNTNNTNVAPYDEFYLVTTENRMGTVKPVRYIIIENDNRADQRLPLAAIQNLTFTLCYLYPNWSDSIKLPAPTQLAHKLAYLVGESRMETPEYHRDIFPLYYYL
jgi:aubergine-like protein